MSTDTNNTWDDYASVRDLITNDSPDISDALNSTQSKRNVAVLLINLRNRAGLSQKEVCAAAGWNKAFVSRIESAQGSIPDIQTIARYAKACKAEIGFVVCATGRDGGPAVVDALPFDLTGGTYFKALFPGDDNPNNGHPHAQSKSVLSVRRG